VARGRTARRWWKKKEHEDPEGWTVHELFGYYVSHHCERYGRWIFSAAGAVEIVSALRILARRVGMEEARQAVMAVFGQKWIERGQWMFFGDRDKYAKYVHPHLKVASGREQSEWSGRRDFKQKRYNPAEFFGRGG
jgi:hypothetical protein